MPERLRFETLRSMEISFNRLSPGFGCGLMLSSLPAFTSSDPLITIMSNYGFEKIYADKTAQKILTNSGLLKTFYDNAFKNKTPLQQNFRSTFGNQEIFLVFDNAIKTAWFIAEPQNKIALANYFRDAVSFRLKSEGIVLFGSTNRLTPVGWQNLHDLLQEKFMQRLGRIERVEIANLLTGVRWAPPTLKIGVTLLNMKEFKEIWATVDAALKGGPAEETQR
ncbi:MAG: hypothetical protein ABIK23_02330 [candidate division WOR-3 bacterium]